MNDLTYSRSIISNCCKLFIATSFSLVLMLHVAPAVASSGFKNATSEKIWAYCFPRIGNGQFTLQSCKDLTLFADPVSFGINSFHFEMNYNTSLYTFDPTKSGLVGHFTVGGDLGPGSGFGTEQLELAPTAAFNFGTPLSGSTYTVSDVGGLVTVDASFSSPVFTAGEVNLLALNFKLNNPTTIDLAKSFVTYHPSSPGSDFSAGAFSCSTSDGGSSCGSDTPSEGVSIVYGTVPEPASWAMMIVGFGAVGATLRRRHFNSIAA